MCIYAYFYICVYVCVCLLVDNNGHFGWRHLYLKVCLEVSFNEGGVRRSQCISGSSFNVQK